MKIFMSFKCKSVADDLRSFAVVRAPQSSNLGVVSGFSRATLVLAVNKDTDMVVSLYTVLTYTTPPYAHLITHGAVCLESHCPCGKES